MAGSGSPERETLQRWMLDVVAHPAGVNSLGADRAAIVGRHVRGDARASAADRLGIYANAYFARIHGAVSRDFPALAQLVGEAAFHDLVRLYLVVHPSNRFSLRDVAAELPAFLAAPAGRYFAERWPCAADLAALEWALVDVFDAPDASTLTREVLAARPPERWADLVLARVPASTLLELDWPVHALRAATNRSSAPPEDLRPATTHVVVWRRDEHVHHRAIPPLEAQALARLATPTAFGDLCDAVADACGHGAEPIAELVALLGRWIEDGLLGALDDCGSGGDARDRSVASA